MTNSEAGMDSPTLPEFEQADGRADGEITPEQATTGTPDQHRKTWRDTREWIERVRAAG